MKLNFFILLLFLSVTSCNPGGNSTVPGKGANKAIQPVFAQPVMHTCGADTSKANKSIHALLQDKAGNIWFGTDGDGVYCYDPSTTLKAGGKCFTHFTQKEGLCSNFIRTMLEDKVGNIWFGTEEGICRYNKTLNTLDAELFTNISDNVYHRNKDITCGLVDSRGNIWFGTDGGVFIYKGNSMAYYPLPKTSGQSSLSPGSAPNYSNDYTVFCLLEDKSGKIWLGTLGKGVCCYNPSASIGNGEISFTYFSEKEGFSKSPVRSLYEDKAGNIWLGTNGVGTYRYTPSPSSASGEKSFTNFSEAMGLNNSNLRTGLKDKTGNLALVSKIEEDKTGNLWFATVDSGVWRYEPLSPHSKGAHILTNFTIRDGLCSNSIVTMLKDKVGNLWFGTEGGGVSLYDGNLFVGFTIPSK
jgi:ligand-binding sensor domain-containing protein